jgi:hypothetical protein
VMLGWVDPTEGAEEAAEDADEDEEAGV